MTFVLKDCKSMVTDVMIDGCSVCLSLVMVETRDAPIIGQQSISADYRPFFR